MNFTQTLIDWYSVNKRNLPWRETKKPYFIWLSEIILQQTRIDQGLPYYNAFKLTFPTVQDLADAEEHEVLKLWQGLGYYSRARNLHHTAKHIAYERNGNFPNTYKKLLSLKGVGDYTASAIASICYDESCAVVDGNVYRVLSRFFDLDVPINSSNGTKTFKSLAQSLLPKQGVGDYNQAIMEFGAVQCKPRNPDCTTCPLSNSCMAFSRNKVSLLPVKVMKSKISKRYFNFLVFVNQHKETIIEQRKENGIWKNLYQFPLIESSTSLSEMQIKEGPEFNKFLDASKSRIILFNDQEVIHKLSHQHLYTKFWIVETESLPQLGIKTTNIHDYPVPILIGNFIDEFNF